MIFIAIPLASVGGVLALWLRDMPFSVSAGVGFIALFGIAVLNGIVLIEHLKALQKQDFKCMKDLIMKGTKDRLRPVLLTAATDALGFLPMAISIGAGAEVQRPLATVVIGGLITSTMLTLIALPILFELFHNVTKIKLFPFRLIRSKTCSIIVFLIAIPAISGFAQSKELNLDQLTEMAIENNQHIKAWELKTDQAKTLAKSVWTLPKTHISYGTDQNNIAENGHPLLVWGIEQEMAFPSFYSAQHKGKQLEASLVNTEFEIAKSQLSKKVAFAYFELKVLLQKQKRTLKLDSIYGNLLSQAEKRYDSKDISHLELLNTQSKRNKVVYQLRELTMDVELLYKELKMLTNHQEDFSISVEEELLRVDENSDQLPFYTYLELQSGLAENDLKIEKAKRLPDLSLNYFMGTNTYTEAKKYHGFEVGVAVPLFYGNHKNKVIAARMALDAQQQFTENERAEVDYRLQKLKIELENLTTLIEQYRENDLPYAKEIKASALKTYQLGEIDFANFALSMEAATEIEMIYLEYLLRYNKVSAEIKFFTH